MSSSEQKEKVIFGTNVRILDGFYKGQTGIVIAYDTHKDIPFSQLTNEDIRYCIDLAVSDGVFSVWCSRDDFVLIDSCGQGAEIYTITE